MANKMNIRKGNDAFKVTNDGTIVRANETDNARKTKNGFGITGFILSLLMLGGFVVIVGMIMDAYSNAHFEMPSWPNNREWESTSFAEWFNRRYAPLIFLWAALFFGLMFSTTFSLIGIFKKPRWIAGFVVSAIVLIASIVLCIFYYTELAYHTVYY
jgi:membrane-associated protease RseP (regulator of RpoE activity)